MEGRRKGRDRKRAEAPPAPEPSKSKAFSRQKPQEGPSSPMNVVSQCDLEQAPPGLGFLLYKLRLIILTSQRPDEILEESRGDNT